MNSYQAVLHQITMLCNDLDHERIDLQTVHRLITLMANELPDYFGPMNFLDIFEVVRRRGETTINLIAERPQHATHYLNPTQCPRDAGVGPVVARRMAASDRVTEQPGPFENHERLLFGGRCCDAHGGPVIPVRGMAFLPYHGRFDINEPADIHEQRNFHRFFEERPDGGRIWHESHHYDVTRLA